MRILLCSILSVTWFLGSAQSPKADRSERGSLQLEAGFFGDFFYKSMSGPQMALLSGKALPTWAPQTQKNLSESSTSSINLGYYTLSYQKPWRPGGSTWWAAGLSFLVRSVAECAYSTDTVTLQHTVQPPGDFKEKKTWLGSAGIRGSQINLPLGIRFMNSELAKRWVSFGINIAPGLIFDHQYIESLTIITATASIEPWGDGPFENVESSAENHYSKSSIPGTYFTAYAGLPVSAHFNPERRWQFTLSFEPGYTTTWLGHGITSAAVMMRMGLGIKHII